MGSLIYVLYTTVDLYLAVHNLEKLSSNPGKVHFEGLVQLLRYIRDIKILRLKYYSKIEDTTLSDLLIQAIIKYEKKLMLFYDSIWQNC